ncbi:hypothetical protein CCACVL1_30382, partial [Corchorus capsularis]
LYDNFKVGRMKIWEREKTRQEQT